MRGQLITVVLLTALLGCSTSSSPSASPSDAISPASGAISCQPYMFSPAPVPFSFPPRPVTSSVAELTAVALLRSCATSWSLTISDIKTSSAEATGRATGPNDGQPVWLVDIDSTAHEAAGAFYVLYFLVEVNKASGDPTVVANG